jgi:DNA-binding SARP family transcriptional activator
MHRCTSVRVEGRRVKFRILGPLRVTGDDGQAVTLEPRQARVLSTLLLAPNRTVARPQLVDAAWDVAPLTAARQIQNVVSNLRRRVGREITADRPGYRIDVDRLDLDSLIFADRLREARQFIGQGHPVEAAGRLRSALSLWRGPTLAGLAGRTVEAAAAGLEEQRLNAYECCLELDLDAGRHHEVVSELAELVTMHPLRERLVGQFMWALHRCGRSADALTEYRRLRERLVDELGIEPGAGLRETYATILRADRGPPRKRSTVESGGERVGP